MTSGEGCFFIFIFNFRISIYNIFRIISNTEKMGDLFQDETTKIYNTYPEKYKSNTQGFRYDSGLIEFFQSLLPGKRVLDIGCAYGREVLRLRDKGFEAFGIDLAEKLIQIAPIEIRGYLKVANMLDIKKIYNSDPFHGIICGASIVHMDKEHGISVLKQSYDILFDKGILFLSIKIRNEDEEEVIIKESVTIPDAKKKYVYYLSSEIDDILKSIGFKILKQDINNSKSDTWKTIIAEK